MLPVIRGGWRTVFKYRITMHNAEKATISLVIVGFTVPTCIVILVKFQIIFSITKPPK